MEARSAKNAETRVAALYVDGSGVYANLPGVEVWDEARDARLYAGPWPVVAHPPCARWCALAPLNESRLGDGYRVGEDGGCFAAALRSVREHGGVLEHPAQSFAWPVFELPRPARSGWAQSFFDEGFVTEVDQHAYGHRSHKRTWLYFVGAEPPALDWARSRERLPQTTGVGRDRKPWLIDEAMRVRPREASSTPPAFRDVLLDMARSANRVTA